MPDNTGSWFQQGPGSEASSIGKVTDEPLTMSADQQTAGSTSSEIVAAAAAGTVSRTITIIVPVDAAVDADGMAVTLNFGAAAVAATHGRLEPGRAITFVTNQHIQAIRNGGTDVVLDVFVGVKT